MMIHPATVTYSSCIHLHFSSHCHDERRRRVVRKSEFFFVGWLVGMSSLSRASVVKVFRNTVVLPVGSLYPSICLVFSCSFRHLSSTLPCSMDSVRLESTYLLRYGDELVFICSNCVIGVGRIVC